MFLLLVKKGKKKEQENRDRITDFRSCERQR